MANPQTTAESFEGTRCRAHQPSSLVWALAVVANVAVLTLIGLSFASPISIVLAAAPLALLIIFKHPHFSTCLVVFLIYSNIPVVAAQFHGVPYTVAGAIPGLLIVPIAYFLWVRKEGIVFPKQGCWILLLVIVQGTGVVFARHPDFAFATFTRSLAEGAAIFLLVVNAVRTPANLRHSLYALLAAGAVMGAVTGYQYLTKSFHNDYGGLAQTNLAGFGVETTHGRVVQARAAGSIGEQNRYAQVMLMLLPIGVFACAAENTAWRRTALMIATGLIAVGWVVSFSRGSVVALVATLCIGAVFGYVRLRHLGSIAVAGMLLLAVMPQYRARMESLLAAVQFASQSRVSAEGPDGSLRGRATEMLAAARVFADYPVVGVGPGMFRFYAREYGQAGGFRALEGQRRSHNLYLSIAAEHGALGLAFFLLAVSTTIRDLHMYRKKCLRSFPALSFLAAGLIGGLVIYLTSGMFLHYSYIRYFWVVFSLAIAASCVMRRHLEVRNTSSDS